MKKIVCAALVGVCMFCSATAPTGENHAQPAERQSSVSKKIPGDVVVDKIEAVVSGPMATVLVLASDLDRQMFRGGTTTKALAEEIVGAQRGKDAGLEFKKEDVITYLQRMSRGAPVTEKDLAAMAQNFAYDNTEELIDDLLRLMTANSTTEQEIRAYLSVSEQEARAYYDEHAESKDGIYYLQVANMPFDTTIDHVEQEKRLKEPGMGGITLEWGDVFSVEYGELDESRSFVRSMKIGDVYVMCDETGFRVYRLKNSIAPGVVPFENKKSEIIMLLREQKFNKAYEKYRASIMDDANVEYRD